MTQPAHRKLWSGLTSQQSIARVGILGIPFDNGASFRKGAAEAPARIHSITPHIAPRTEDGHTLDAIQICDYGDVSIDLDWHRYFKTVETQATTVLKHPFAIFIGGDHSITIPLIKAFDVVNDQPFGIIHIDSHTDLMDSFEGHHWSHACTGRRHLEATNLAPQHLAFIGIRSWLQEEVEILKDLNQVRVHSAKSLYKRGIQAIVDDVIIQMEGLSRIYLTLDIDCLDPAFAPGTGTPESGGMSSRELLTLLEGLFTALPIRAMDIVEVSPPLDHSDITSMLAIKIIYEVLGWIANPKA